MYHQRLCGNGSVRRTAAHEGDNTLKVREEYYKELEYVRAKFGCDTGTVPGRWCDDEWLALICWRNEELGSAIRDVRRYLTENGLQDDGRADALDLLEKYTNSLASIFEDYHQGVPVAEFARPDPFPSAAPGGGWEDFHDVGMQLVKSLNQMHRNPQRCSGYYGKWDVPGYIKDNLVL